MLLLAWVAALSLPVAIVVLLIWAALQDDDIAAMLIAAVLLIALLCASLWGASTLHKHNASKADVAAEVAL